MDEKQGKTPLEDYRGVAAMVAGCGGVCGVAFAGMSAWVLSEGQRSYYSDMADLDYDDILYESTSQRASSELSSATDNSNMLMGISFIGFAVCAIAIICVAMANLLIAYRKTVQES